MLFVSDAKLFLDTGKDPNAVSHSQATRIASRSSRQLGNRLLCYHGQTFDIEQL